MASIGAFYLLRDQSVAVARRCLSIAVVVGLVASIAAAVPTGDIQAKLVYEHQPITFAAMEGHFHTTDRAGLVILLLVGAGDVHRAGLHLDCLSLDAAQVPD